ncbi:hypothetical protein SpCBS45565_g05422 [Spizellomyces sp. 'palustris']|nr:hypothetical protein SpCBS45565_g05422 [Spizellomyces sp. 'palustris']
MPLARPSQDGGSPDDVPLQKKTSFRDRLPTVRMPSLGMRKLSQKSPKGKGAPTTSAGREISIQSRMTLNMDTRMMNCIVLGLILVDFLTAQAALYESIFDTAVPPAMNKELYIASTLKTNIPHFTTARTFLFAFSLGLRILFVIEILLRVISSGPLNYLRSPCSILDAAIVIASIVVHTALPARESLLANNIIFLRFGRVYALMDAVKWDIVTRTKKDVEIMRREWDEEMGLQRQRTRTLKRQVSEHKHKLKVLTGDMGVMDAEREREVARSTSTKSKRQNYDYLSE